MDASSSKQAYIFSRKFTNRKVYFLKSIEIAHTASPPNVIHAIEMNSLNTFL